MTSTAEKKDTEAETEKAKEEELLDEELKDTPAIFRLALASLDNNLAEKRAARATARRVGANCEAMRVAKK